MRGGAREGSGRPARYPDPLDKRIAVRLRQGDAEYLIAWCNRKHIPLSALLRETALRESCAIGLGIGLDAANYLGEYGPHVAVDGPLVLPVRVSTQQRDCIRVHAKRIGAASVSGMMREAAIAHAEADTR